MYKILLISVLFCIAELGFAKKKIDLRAQFRSPQFCVEAFIDENSNDLIVVIDECLSNIKVLVTDISGHIVCHEEINNNGISVIKLPIIEAGEYVLHITVGNIELNGVFDANSKIV